MGRSEQAGQVEVRSADEVVVATCPGDIARVDGFSLRWIHSVELEAWQEDFQVSETGEILIVGTRFRTFGAGTPDVAPVHETRDGWVLMSGFDRVVDPLVIRAGATTNHQFVCESAATVLDPGQYRISFMDPMSVNKR